MWLLFATGWIRPADITSDMRLAGLSFFLAVTVLSISCDKSETSHQKIVVGDSETLIEVRDASPQEMSAASKSIEQFLQAQLDQSHAWKASELSKINAALANGKSAKISAANVRLVEIS